MRRTGTSRLPQPGNVSPGHGPHHLIVSPSLPLRASTVVVPPPLPSHPRDLVTRELQLIDQGMQRKRRGWSWKADVSVSGIRSATARCFGTVADREALPSPALAFGRLRLSRYELNSMVLVSFPSTNHTTTTHQTLQLRRTKTGKKMWKSVDAIR